MNKVLPESTRHKMEGERKAQSPPSITASVSKGIHPAEEEQIGDKEVPAKGWGEGTPRSRILRRNGGSAHFLS